MIKQNRSGVSIAILYFVIHFFVEIICFFTLYRYFGNPAIPLLVAVTYDAFAFVTQGLLGELIQRFPRMDFGSAGAVLMAAGVLLIHAEGEEIISVFGLILLGIGNAFLHECGAIETVKFSGGALFPAAFFVGGGSFGLILGQIMGKSETGLYVLIPVFLLLEAFVIAANLYSKRTEPVPGKFELTDPKAGYWLVCIVAFLITAVRSFIGYAIPISWKKEVWQGVFLFFMMGAGKALGGYISDRFGARKTGIWTSLLCIPFLIFGENVMVVSIIGVFLFSMTMSITFGMFLSVVQDDPGLAFGGTTLGLFAGLIPVFLGFTPSGITGSILVVALSLLCALGFARTLK